MLAEYDVGGNLGSEYVYLGGRRTARRDASGTGAAYCYFADHLGTNRVMTNATGTTQQESDYEPFGVERSLTNLVANKYKFTGKERDTETGNDHFWARNYSSTLGRWITPDPGGKNVVHLGDPQTWNMYAYVRNNPTTLTDPTGLTIDSSACDANKQCAKWKANYLTHKEAQKQWKALDENKNLLVKLKWDPKSSKSVTDNYKWNDSGKLTDVTVTLAGKTGHVDNALEASKGYVFGATIKTDPLRQAYVIAHEFGHVEQAEEPGINVLYNWMSEQGTRLSQAEQQYGPVGYSKLGWPGPLERTLDALHLTLEQGADTRGKEVVTGDDEP